MTPSEAWLYFQRTKVKNILQDAKPQTYDF